MYILVVGNPVDGCDFYGPFEDPEDLNVWAYDHLRNQEWWVAKLGAIERGRE